MLDDEASYGKLPSHRTAEDSGLREWAKTFGVSEDRLRQAIDEAGPMLKDVAAVLGKPL